MGSLAVTPSPAASQWSPGPHPGQPPEKVFDFPEWTAGDQFAPAFDAFITARWLPVLPWPATARIVEVADQCLRWTEEADLFGRVPFSASVVLERTGDWTVQLRIDAALGKRHVPRMTTDYELVGAGPNFLALRDLANPADMLSVVRQTDDGIIQFHFRLPFGIAVHKSGLILRLP